MTFLFLAWLGVSSAFAAAPCNTPTAACEGMISVVPNGNLAYSSTFDLDTLNPDVTDAVIVIHGIGRDYGSVFNQMVSLVQAGALPSNTLIIAPHFLADVDKPIAGLLYWPENDWPAGDNSLDGSKTSSFTVLDEIVRKVAGSGNFPGLQQITVTGLSAGGQTTQRYAAGNAVQGEFPQMRFRYVVASPSSYMYLNGDRWVPNSPASTADDFKTPANPGCAYNQYRYGTDGLNAYMSSKSAAQLVQDYVSRDVNYVVGALDDATVYNPVPPVPYDFKDAMDLDVSCPAEWEGNSRAQRSFLYNEYMNVEFPQNKHVWISVPGVAHENRVYADPSVANLLHH